MTQVLPFREAIKAVGEWSYKNFGDQKGAGPLAPLAGIVEEIGEQESAFDPDEIVDGYCDQLVYLADVCYRSCIVIDPEWNNEIAMALVPSLSVGLGQLAHAVLKHHQGIRGFDDPTKFQSHVEEAAANVFHAINRAWNKDDECLDRCLGEEFTGTWQRVSQRNWAAYPTTG